MKTRRTLRLIPIFVGGLLVFSSSSNALISNATGPVVPNGAALYGSKCVICHGRNGSGTPAWRSKGQPDLSNADWQKTHSDQQIAERIRVGKGKMPAFGDKLSEEEVGALVKQVRSLKK
jgi:mono/diheme cytochrome c family protein